MTLVWAAVVETIRMLLSEPPPFTLVAAGEEAVVVGSVAMVSVVKAALAVVAVLAVRGAVAGTFRPTGWRAVMVRYLQMPRLEIVLGRMAMEALDSLRLPMDCLVLS